MWLPWEDSKKLKRAVVIWVSPVMGILFVESCECFFGGKMLKI